MQRVEEQGDSCVKGQGMSSAFIISAMRDAFNSHPRKWPALVHHTVRKVLMHKYRLDDRYILFPCLPHPMHTCVGASIGIGGGVGGADSCFYKYVLHSLQLSHYVEAKPLPPLHFYNARSCTYGAH